MDINNNQQINTFTKGMDTDTSDMYIGEGSYRYAENLRVVTDKDGNTGELHLIEGTDIVPNHKKDPQYIGTEQLLGFTSIRQYIIEVVKHGDTWGIYRSDVAGQRQLVAGWFDKQIWPDGWKGKTKPLSLVTRWEADDNIKLYIANGHTEVLSINVAPRHEQVNKSFEEVFQTIKILLEPIKAEVTSQEGAKIPGVVIQYAYITYSVHGAASSMSILSNTVKEFIDETRGYEVDAMGNKVIKLTLPESLIGKYVRIYRVAYSRSGQLPKVDIIYDQECTHEEVLDSGQSLVNVATAEFISTNKLLFVPKELESKGDYLFAANLEYSQDTIDEQFAEFDARCYSDGNYYYENGQKVYIKSNNYSILPQTKGKALDLRHDQFDNTDADFKPEYWASSDGVNGHGLCFNWKYVYNDYSLNYMRQYASAGANQTVRTYARNEVYRFGVRLFDEKGNASSVKWIADIKMPNYYNHFDNGIQDANIKHYAYSNPADNSFCTHVYPVSIEFQPIQNEYWHGVSKYEIVQARRSIEDSYKITQGIAGFPTMIQDDSLCLPYFLTTDPFKVRKGLLGQSTDGMQVGLEYRQVDDVALVRDYDQYTNCLVYACPEYTYQPDDIQSLLKRYNSNIYYKTVSVWSRDAKITEITEKVGNNNTFNSQESPNNSNLVFSPIHVLSYIDSEVIPHQSQLTANGTDLRIQVGIDVENQDYYGHYCLSNQALSTTNNSEQTWTPLGGQTENTRGSFKMVYFTNMYSQNIEESNYSYTPIKVSNTTFIEAQSSDSFAKDERPTYKSQFKTLRNGKKFFNWINPALFDDQIYNRFVSGGDATKESWQDITMTSMDEGRSASKHTWAPTNLGHSVQDENALAGCGALAFPTGVGGPNIVLEFNQDVKQQLGGPRFSITNGIGIMPTMMIANVCKSATPYNGYNITAINNTQYISSGYVSSPNQKVTMNMGDNYITMFVYCLYHNFDNAQHNIVPTAALQYIVPIESTIDLSKQCSEYLQAENTSAYPVGGYGNGVWVQAKPSTVGGRFTQTTDMYMYNTAYSVLPDIVTYAGQDTVNAADSLYDSRIHYSQKKQNNELIDNWTSFKAIDYLDVDSRYGQITGLKLFKDKLIFLQENGAGVLSVNDRIILKDQESANIIVGNGGVLDRYDYFTTIYGMKPDQHVVEATNDALYWWDGHRREILGYTDGYNIALLQRIKNVQNYINNGTESDTPSIICDANNKEVLFNVVNDESLVYNEQVQQFTSVYTFNPIYYCNIDGVIYLTDDWSHKPNLYTYNTGDDEATLFEDDNVPVPAKPKLKYVVNKDPIYNKVFDVQTFGGRFYGGDDEDSVNLNFDYKTPLKQHSRAEHGEGITNREYDYRLAIPRNNDDLYGGRMRGKTMECEITSDSNNKDFSIQYVTTKYRMSWT